MFLMCVTCVDHMNLFYNVEGPVIALLHMSHVSLVTCS